MELIEFLHLLVRWLRLIVLAAALGGSIGYMVSQRQPPVYEASTMLLITTSTPEPDPRQALIPAPRDSLVKTYKELLLRRPVLEAVINDLDLSVDTATLAEQLRVSEVRDTQILVLTARDGSPQHAAALANAMVQAFNQQAAVLLANPYVANRAGLSVIEPAVAPSTAKGATPLRNTAIAAIIGALLAVGVAFAAEYFDNSIRSSRHIALLTDLTTVAEMAQFKHRRLRDKLVTIKAPLSADAEAYRMIRLHLESADNGGLIRTVVITSARPREGKSITAANLAIALAQTGLRVVLIDTNLRRPRVHELFQKPNTMGVTTAMRREEVGRFYAHTVDSGIENLRLLLSGPLHNLALPKIARLLVPQRVLYLIEELKEHADVLIFDSPSVLEVFETSLLARSCDTALLVVQAERTPVDMLLQAHAVLARSRVYILGVVLNRVRRRAYGGAHLHLKSFDPSGRELSLPEIALPDQSRYRPAPVAALMDKPKQAGTLESELTEQGFRS
ncbi:MAG TPA: polysaccharide biosynthesis tyrosine autokinase [Roseiflexaceae bacterium]|nr:polysaccharide biosynthesis tyrosine autokinase [Roseiflexaceae bacterium]